MKNYRHKYQSERGVTLPELLMVTVVIAVVAGIALMQFGGSRAQFGRQNVSQQLKQAFERARFDSVKRRVSNPTTEYARVTITATTFTLTTDRNGNGVTTDAADNVLTNFSGQGITVSNDGLTFPVTVSFDRRGEVTVSGATNPVFLICNGNCTFANDNSSNADIVLVTPTGTVNLLGGGSTIPTFAAPSVTGVSPGTGVDPDVVVP